MFKIKQLICACIIISHFFSFSAYAAQNPGLGISVAEEHGGTLKGNEFVSGASRGQVLMRINLWGSVWCTHAALPHLKRSRGSLVAVSSLAGLVGVPGRTAYSASKFAMTGFFEALRAELKSAGVSVTTAYPGVVATQIRYRGFNAAGTPAGASGLKEDDAMSVETCARLILDGMDKRAREVVMTPKGKLGRWLKLLAPGAVESMALAALKDEVKPH